ncbi:MAG: alpha/beta fold hydrolase [Myxococcales bacterium]|nr:alpha/beta fold hydrolase [Myxococcales bacterium]
MTTYVLVHGAFTGGWYWARVRALLQAAGHPVFTPSLTGSGDRAHLLSRAVTLQTHIQDITELLNREDLHDVVLVGHSYGGMVITGVADREPHRLARLVYLDAAYPVSGQNAAGGFAEGTGDTLDAMSAAGPEDTSWLLPPLPLAAYGVTDPADVAWVGERRTAHPLATLNEALVLRNPTPPLPRSYVRCTQRQGLVGLFGADPLLPMFERAVADGLTITTIDAGHDAMVTAPEQVTRALLLAAGHAAV